MNLQDYCKNVEIELVGWKAKLYDVVRKIDKLGTAERGKILSNVEDLHILLEDIETRIQQLERECPTEWSPIKRSVDEAHVDMRAKYEDTLKAIGEAAPVSVPG